MLNLDNRAGLVRYNVLNWLEKNKDPLNDTVAAVLKHSPKNALLPVLWEDYQTQEEAAEAVKSGGKRMRRVAGMSNRIEKQVRARRANRVR